MSILHRFRDIIAYFPKFQDVVWTRPCQSGSRLSSNDYWLNTAYVCTTITKATQNVEIGVIFGS